jgi:hypothetical protein
MSVLPREEEPGLPLQRAASACHWVGASNRAANVKANHQALANLIKTDHADVAGSFLVRQAEALFNPPKPVQDQELFFLSLDGHPC